MRIAILLPPLFLPLMFCHVGRAEGAGDDAEWVKAAVYEAGDTVIVIHDRTLITFDEKESKEVGRGADLKVEAVNGEMLRVSSRWNSGWISRRHVAHANHSIDAFSDQIQRNPNDWVAWLGRGVAFHLRDEFDKAIADCNQSLLLSPKNALVLSRRGYTWKAKKRFYKAIADFDESILLNSPDAVCLLSLRGRGICRIETQDFDDAASDFSKILQIDPQDAEAFSNRGLCSMHQEDFDRAIADFSEALKIDPKRSKAWDSRLACWFEKKEFDKAIADCDEAIRMDSKNANALYHRALCWLYAKNDSDKGIADLDEAIKINRREPRYFGIRGFCLIYKQEYQKGCADLREFLKGENIPASERASAERLLNKYDLGFVQVEKE